MKNPIPFPVSMPKDPSELSRNNLEILVRNIQNLLWLEERPDGNGGTEEYWDPDKEWDTQMLDAIAGWLHEHDMGVK